jgi:hypothetical protein
MRLVLMFSQKTVPSQLCLSVSRCRVPVVSNHDDGKLSLFEPRLGRSFLRLSRFSFPQQDPLPDTHCHTQRHDKPLDIRQQIHEQCCAPSRPIQHTQCAGKAARCPTCRSDQNPRPTQEVPCCRNHARHEGSPHHENRCRVLQMQLGMNQMVMAVGRPDTGNSDKHCCRDKSSQQRQGHPARSALAETLPERKNCCDQAGGPYRPV